MSAALAVLQAQADSAAAGGFLGGVTFELDSWIRAGLLLFLGIPLAYAVSKWVRSWVAGASSPQRQPSRYVSVLVRPATIAAWSMAS